MANPRLIPLVENLAYYWQVYTVWCDRVNLAERQRSWAENVFPSIVVNKLRQYPEGTTLRTLSIGCGTGDLDCLMLRQLSKRFHCITHTVVEPAESAVEKFMSNVSTADLNAEVTFDWQCSTFQDFQKASKRNPVQYDLIISVHSLYYLGDTCAALDYLANRLTRSGLLMITIDNEWCSNAKLFHQFPEFTDTESDQQTINYPNSSTVKSALKSLGLRVTVNAQSCDIDIESVFDASSTEGNHLLDFLVHSVDFRRTAPADLVKRVLAHLQSAECGEIRQDGSTNFIKCWDTFVVQH